MKGAALVHSALCQKIVVGNFRIKEDLEKYPFVYG
jgi:hypothetical protein